MSHVSAKPAILEVLPFPLLNRKLTTVILGGDAYLSYE